MEKIDRLGWAAGFAFKAYGLKIGVRVNDPAALDRIMKCLPPLWQPLNTSQVHMLFSLWVGKASNRPNVRNYSILYSHLARVGRTMDLDGLFELLENEIQLYIAENAPDRVFVHAGVVGWRGQAIVIPGRSFS